MLPIKSKKDKGFTLIEMLIFITILVVILSISFSFLLVTLRGSSKAEALKKVKQNGDFALSTMERYILSAKKVENPVPEDTRSILVTMLDGSQVTFSCGGDRISSGSSFLTDEEVIVSDCVFEIDNIDNPGQPAVVNIDFTVDYGQPGFLTSEKASLDFSSSFVVRNQK